MLDTTLWVVKGQSSISDNTFHIGWMSFDLGFGRIQEGLRNSKNGGSLPDENLEERMLWLRILKYRQPTVQQVIMSLSKIAGPFLPWSLKTMMIVHH